MKKTNRTCVEIFALAQMVVGVRVISLPHSISKQEKQKSNEEKNLKLNLARTTTNRCESKKIGTNTYEIFFSHRLYAGSGSIVRELKPGRFLVDCPAGPTRDVARIDSTCAQKADVVLLKSLASAADGLGSVGVPVVQVEDNVDWVREAQKGLCDAFFHRCRKRTPQILLGQYRRVCGMAALSLQKKQR